MPQNIKWRFIMNQIELLQKKLDDLGNQINNADNAEEFEMLKKERESVITKLRCMGVVVIDDLTEIPVPKDLL